MYSMDLSPFLWRFTDSSESKSDTCLFQKKFKQSSEIDIQSSKSVHDVTTEHVLDSMSWLSNLVKAKTASTQLVNVEGIPSHQIKFETSAKQKDKTDARQHTEPASLIRPHSSLPLKRQRPVTPDNTVEVVPKKIKSDYVTTKPFRSTEKELQKYLGNKKRKLDNTDFQNDTAAKRSKIQPSDDHRKDATLDAKVANDNLDAKVAIDTLNTEKTDDLIDAEVTDDTLDAEVAMYMEDGGPPTVRAYRPMPHNYIPHLTNTIIDRPLFKCTKGCIHQFRPPLMINRELGPGVIRIIDPWPCRYRNTKFMELKKVGVLDIGNSPTFWREIGTSSQGPSVE